MQFNYAYRGHTAVDNGAHASNMTLVPDAQRPPTFFRGELQQNVAFREAISALHDVVVSDLRYKPRDKGEYKAWAERREQEELSLLAGQVQARKARVKARIDELRSQIEQLRRREQQHRNNVRGAYYRAQRKYFDYLYQRDLDAWFVLDPVVTVHPDQVFFECFSQDESSYGRLSASLNVFKAIDEFACGTTNVDYSAALYGEFQKIRSYKRTHFTVDPGGFEVQTAEDEAWREVKIDLPDSWVRGFLQVSAAMTLPCAQVELHPLDIHNLCSLLRRHRERRGPRSLRFRLTPNGPVTIVVEPWNIELVCPRARYEGPEREIRLWGRRRLFILERLIPVARRFVVYLLGTGMPSFYLADLGDMTFTLGLSGWTANDWSGSANFDLLAPRAEVDSFTQRRVFNALKQTWFEDPQGLARRLQLETAQVLGALGIYTQAGRAIYDLDHKVFRLRELSREPLPMDALRFANPREEAATRWVEQGAVALAPPSRDGDGHLILSGRVANYRPSLVIDGDERVLKAECTCGFYRQNKLFQGPCEHMLALRLAHRRH